MEYVVCIKNKDYKADLILHKIYKAIPDASLETEDLRIIDESGEDYIYPRSYFIPIEIPAELKESFLVAA